MFDLNCFAFGWCCAFAVDALMEEKPMSFFICSFLALANAICIWR